MKVLLIGSGAREHALVWKIAQSKLAEKIFCAPGNAGIAQSAECLPIAVEDVAGLLDFARKERIDLTVVGPEASLACGIVDAFGEESLNVFGPGRKATQLESSKAFAKRLMAKYNIPTAGFEVFDSQKKAQDYLNSAKFPCVIKADGLAAGKGVVIAENKQEALSAVTAMMTEKVFGAAGNTIVIEDCLVGEEASFLSIVDSGYSLPLASSQDHKRAFDGDEGPNTGGMGAYSPAPVITDALACQIQKNIIERTISALHDEGIDYRGILYAGIMVTKAGPKVLEFNVRFGDPETQAILPRLNTDLLQLMHQASRSRLREIKSLEWSKRACVCVVCASAGYPGKYEKGKIITGLDEASKIKDIAIFHAGTKSKPAARIAQPADNGEIFLTDGGRVLGVTSLGDTIELAIKNVYKAVGQISFEGMHYRRDIGAKALRQIKN